MKQCEFKALVESTPDIIARYDPELRHLYVNPAVELATGIAAEDIIGKTNEELGIPAALCDMWNSELRRVFETQWDTVFEFEYPAPTHNRHFRCRIKPEFTSSGEVRSVISIAHDITEQKAAEEALRASEAHYRRLVDNAPDGIYALDAEGRITEMNRKAGEILGREPDEMLGVHFAELLEPESARTASESLERRLAGEGETTDMEVTVVRPSGEQRLVQLRSTAIHQGGRVIGTHGVARDITEEKVREKHLRRAERLASVGTLLSGVAHELNNPLHAIRNFAELLLLDPRTEDDREALDIMKREADRAAKIVNDLRFVARQSQQHGSEKEALDLNDVIRHVLKMRRYVMETRDVEVREELAEDLPRVWANRSEMDQVALNLVLNAEAALTEVSENRRLTIRTAPSDLGATLEIADTGPGIEAGNLDRIFDPFWTTKSPGDGTGLGLSLVHSIVLEHEGTIRVDSTPGQGATFTIDLPARGEGPAPVRPRADPGLPLRKLRILVVDDEKGVRSSLLRFLRRRGHSADEAANGREALDLLQVEKPAYDVILCDLRMPLMDGEELVKRLREDGRGMDEKVVFMTGDAASEEAAKILEATGAPVLIKPVELTEVARVIEEHASRTFDQQEG